METDEQELRSSDRQRMTLVVGAVVVLLAALWVLFLRGGDEGKEATAPAGVRIAAVQPETAEDKVVKPKKPGSGPVETFEVFAPKDPFRPLLNEGGGKGEDGAKDDGDGGDQGSGGGSASQNIEGHTVKLVDVFKEDGKQRAQVQVDSTVYTMDEGETFADNFKLLSVSGQCASMLFGDDQFTLCEGEEILK
jgi:hypothetical protein